MIKIENVNLTIKVEWAVALVNVPLSLGLYGVYLAQPKVT